MTFTNEQLLEAYAAVEWLNQQRLNMKAAQKVRRMRRALQGHEKDARELVLELFKRYGREKPDGTLEVLRDDAEAKGPEREQIQRQYAQFTEERAELLALEVDVGDLETVTDAELWYRGDDQKRIELDVSGDLLDKLGPLYREAPAAA